MSQADRRARMATEILLKLLDLYTYAKDPNAALTWLKGMEPDRTPEDSIVSHAVRLTQKLEDELNHPYRKAE